MANYHVVPRGDAITHDTHGDRCQCTVEIRTTTSDEKPGEYDVWHYHRVVSLDEAVMAESSDEPDDPYAAYRVSA